MVIKETDDEFVLEAYLRAKDVLKFCSTSNGFFASAGKEGYNAVWARDSMISSLGAGLLNDFKEVIKKSLITLGDNQSYNGQIPNAVDKFSERKKHVDFQSIDSTLWFIIGHFLYKKRYRDKSMFKKYNDSLAKALLWLSFQDISEKGMLNQLPTTDWQDAFPHKYGHTINTQALYYMVLTLVRDKKKAKKLKKIVNDDSEWGLWNGKYYYAYRWKNHNNYKETGDWFDTLGNLLAIVFDLATSKKAEKILSYIRRNKLSNPYPVMAIYPPITEKSVYWQDYFKDCDAREPYSYSNAGIWGYIGGFYVLALIKMKKFKDAKKELVKLAKCNIRGNFPEWTHPKTKEHYGRLQAWEAGMYLLAYESLKKKRVLI